MRPTRWSWLLAVGVVAAAVAYVVTRNWYYRLPTPSFYALLWLALLGIAESYVAGFTRARLAGRSGTRPIDPLFVAKLAALAKASSVVGALVAGGYAGFLAWVGRLDTPAAHRDTKTAAVGVAAGLLLVGGALFLEHVCRVPPGSDDDDETSLPDSDGR
jgi:4-amino-4-deoxy-L-arabinose transferase-like glycosyltransferase